MRLDRFLWFARITKTRSLAQALTAQGRSFGELHVYLARGGRAVGGPGSPQDVKAQRESGTNLTKEPPASQRVDPMKVLDKK